LKKLGLGLLVCIFVATSFTTTSCTAITPVGGLLILGAAGLVAYTAFDEATKVDLTVVNLTGRPMKVWIDFKMEGTVQSGSTAVFALKLGAHTLQAGEATPEYNTMHNFEIGDPFTWTLQ
jgi:hypothetical protein